jgi:hypothetical protein
MVEEFLAWNGALMPCLFKCGRGPVIEDVLVVVVRLSSH